MVAPPTYRKKGRGLGLGSSAYLQIDTLETTPSTELLSFGLVVGTDEMLGPYVLIDHP